MKKRKIQNKIESWNEQNMRGGIRRHVHKRGGGGLPAAAPPFVKCIFCWFSIFFAFLLLIFISFHSGYHYFILFCYLFMFPFLFYILFFIREILGFIFYLHFFIFSFSKKAISNIGTKFLFPEWNAHNSTFNVSYATIFSQNCCKWSKLSF